jgi:hypothetical protein
VLSSPAVRQEQAAMRFGLKSLLVAMGVLGVALYFLFAAPNIVASTALIFAWVLAAAFFASGIVYGRGAARAFCVGALFPAGATFFGLAWILLFWLMGGFNDIKDFRALFEYLGRAAFTLRVWTAAGSVMCLLAGGVSVAGRLAWTTREFEAVDSTPGSPDGPPA